MDAVIVVAFIVGAGFFSGYYIRDREERRRNKTARRINLS